MKRHLLVFDDGSGDDLALQDFVETLGPGAKMYTMDGHVCFLTSNLSTSEISDRFLKLAGSRLFFVADVTASDCAGRMLGGFWEYMKRDRSPAAAE
ncbi:hypothetical protein A1351_16035 [Methylosinus sp. R-45379]|uniref:hypothetical protein n=1 Tax=Methylosinus sp. R-45379 TaxID=980563 RepID=UPI0007C88E46|nr:hypothetical protein [Methylosinus sp. R-45379]OAI25720.1 hypothetical protein A1351_16035 [Methylosinus sp. R-45379]